MPGLTIANFKLQHVVALSGNSENRFQIRQKLDVIFEAYEAYPRLSFETEDYLIIVEGEIYNHQSDALKKLLPTFFKTSGDLDYSDVTQFVSNADGEFLLLFAHKNSNSIFLVNDALGRLPVYCYRKGNQFIVSREIRRIRKSVSTTLNQEHFALYLLFGYSIGFKTFWNEIEKIPPHSIVQLSADKVNISSFFNIEINFSQRQIINSDVLLELLSEGFLSRVSRNPAAVLALSGGLDSRLLTGIMKSRGCDIPIYTYYVQGDESFEDLVCAQQITSQLGLTARHHKIDLGEVSKNDLDKLIEIKQGLNYLGMGFYLPFLDALQSSKQWQITGDGGDKTLDSLLPLIPLRNANHFLDYLISVNSIFDVQQVTKISGVEYSTIKDLILQEVSKYDAQSWDDRYANFILRERAFNWLFEGEDRNRFYTWSSTPFYSSAFFKEALLFPMQDKKQGSLFKSMLIKLPGDLGSITNPNWKVSLNDSTGVRKMFYKQEFKQRYPALFKYRKVANHQSLEFFMKKYQLLEIDGKSLLESLTIKLDNKKLNSLKLSESAFWHLMTAFKIAEKG